MNFTIGAYSQVKLFSESLTLVKYKDGLSQINNIGRGVIKFDKDAVYGGPFKEGKAWTKFKDGKGHYIGNKVKYLSEIFSGFSIGEQDNYSERFGSVSLPHAYGVDCFILDSDGNKTDKFKEYKKLGDYGGLSENNSWFIYEGNLYGYINSNSKKS